MSHLIYSDVCMDVWQILDAVLIIVKMNSCEKAWNKKKTSYVIRRKRLKLRLIDFLISNHRKQCDCVCYNGGCVKCCSDI